MSKKSFQISLTVLQSAFLAAGGVFLVLLSFVLGIMLGKEMKAIPLVDEGVKSQVVKMKIEPLPLTSTANTSNSESPAAMKNLTSKPVITFYDTLTKPNSKKSETRNEAKTDELPETSYTIQVGAMKDKTLANAMVSKLKKNGYSAYIASWETPEKGVWYKVRLGSFSSKEEAREEAAKIKKNEGLPATVMVK